MCRAGAQGRSRRAHAPIRIPIAIPVSQAKQSDSLGAVWEERRQLTSSCILSGYLVRSRLPLCGEVVCALCQHGRETNGQQRVQVAVLPIQTDKTPRGLAASLASASCQSDTTTGPTVLSGLPAANAC